ncbi:hypothetical protein GQ457_08G023080 [Hibiscus cannabinus]
MILNEPCWDEILVRQVFLQSDTNRILQCPIVLTREEVLLWFDHSFGIYSTKSAYLWLLYHSSSNVVVEGIRKVIASLQTLPKIMLFAWRDCHDALPTRNRLLSVGIDYGLCKLCEGEVESSVHALCDCVLAKEILEISDVLTCERDVDHVSIKDWFSVVLLSFHKDLFTSLVVMLWNI